ncbi:MAG: hypothetical protein IIC06_01920 [Proteobacteria bacterium]|nr:hypothetical protein [Pseudomonadota bacterium]
MDIRPIEYDWSDEMSVETAEPVAAPGGRYPLRFMARVFGFLGVATAVYAGALVAVAFEAGIIEF